MTEHPGAGPEPGVTPNETSADPAAEAAGIPGSDPEDGADDLARADGHAGWQVPGQPEREMVVRPTSKRHRRPRRAVRGGTNPSAEEVPDVVAPRDPLAPDEPDHDRWLREQRPPHWE